MQNYAFGNLQLIGSRIMRDLTKLNHNLTEVEKFKQSLRKINQCNTLIHSRAFANCGWLANTNIQFH